LPDYDLPHHAARLLVDLDRRLVVIDPNDLADELIVTDADKLARSEQS